jgi:putative pyruvate formate lyase activating enzyme
VCGAGTVLKIGRAALHWWEEPCLVGDRGSGAIFFAHCALGCVYCQNKRLAQGEGIEVSPQRLSEIMLELQNDQHAANINLVTASHYAPTVAAVLAALRETGQLHIPVVWNTAGYERAETLALLDGLVDLYLVDFKYANPVTAKRLSRAEDYPAIALHAIETMIDQVGAAVFDDEGYMQRGVIVRHLVLPGYVDDSFAALKVLHERFGTQIMLSIMNQFTIVDDAFDYARYGLDRAVSHEAYECVLDFVDELGIEDYFWQEGGAASESFVPAFDGTGVIRQQKR